MRFVPTSIEGAYLIEIQPMEDERGFFARTWSQEAFREMRLETVIEDCAISFNRRRGTLRGLHYQVEPHGEAKLVRCTNGAVFDVILDLRRESRTFALSWSAELSAADRRSVYVPRGVAHGFLTLVDNAEVSYQISARYDPASAQGVRWDDPAFNIRWPADVPVVVISARDRSYPSFAR